MDYHPACILAKNIIMKKILLVLFVCSVSTDIIAQKTKAEKAETPTQSALSTDEIAPPPPPLPPPPAAPEPPVPPPPPPTEQVAFSAPTIVSDKGYNLSVHYYNGKNLVYMKKGSVTEKVSLDKWNDNRSYYENKYGILPPPPPPPAPPARPSPPSE
jgi:hypothetical protein